MLLIKILLAIAALYSGGMYLWCWVQWIIYRHRYSVEAYSEMNRFSFQLALCFILSIGFLGMMGV